MADINKIIGNDSALNENFKKIVEMYEPKAEELPTYESMVIKTIFKAYNN